jgi:hypothetical protein
MRCHSLQFDWPVRIVARIAAIERWWQVLWIFR